ncbi:O-antigen ligase-like membrane protein [Frondihabitans sp. PhB188]|nr:O-antigen ligase-like membrane protein [Frondihabitans sp. PhB188]
MTVVVHLVIELRRAGSPRQRRTIIVVSAAMLAVVVATTLALPATRARFVSTDGLAFESAADRLLIWREALAVIAQRPVLGWGPSGFLDAVSRVHGAQWQRDVGSATTLDSPHNWILQLLSAGGILLVCVGLVAIVLGVVSARRNWTAATRPPADGPPVSSDPDRADVLAAAVAALSGLAVGWSVTFTAPGTVILPALLFGALVARAPAPKRALRRPLGALRSVGVVAWCAFLGVAAVADIPLGNGVTAAAAGDIARADSSFETTARLRPWDADVASIAAQSLAASADAGNTAAAPLTVNWARRALRSTPGDLLASKALAVGEQYTGDLDGAASTLRGLANDHPYDSEVAQRLGGVLLVQGKVDDATTELVRASELAPDDVDIWKTLAFAYQQSGDEASQTRAEARIADLSGGGR